MKKKGTALVTVLIIFTALIIIGTSISSSVINSAKLNKRYSDTMDLELAAKSGVNIVKEDFISKINKGEIKTLDNVNSYITDVNSGNLDNLFQGYTDNNIKLKLTLNLDSSDSKYKLKIISTAKNQGSFSVEKVEEQSLLLNIGNGETNTGDSGGNNQTVGTSGILGIANEDAVLIIQNKDNIIAMDHVNNGVIVVEEGKKYNNYNNSSGLHNPSGTIASDLNIDIPRLNITNPITDSAPFYLKSNGIISNEADLHTQDYYKIQVDGEYQIKEIYYKNGYGCEKIEENKFIVVTVNGDLTIQGNQNAQNINRNIIYVVYGNVKLISNNDMLMQGTAIMAKSVKQVGNIYSKIGFNSGLVITKEIYLPNGYINSLSRRSDAIKIIDSIIKGASI